MRCWMRVSFPDRAAMLGAVAARLGDSGADIRSAEVAMGTRTQSVRTWRASRVT